MGANFYVKVHLKLADNSEENFDTESENIYYLLNHGGTDRHYMQSVKIHLPYILTPNEREKVEIIQLTDDDYEEYDGIPERFVESWASPEEYEIVLKKSRLALYKEVENYREESRKNYSTNSPAELQKAAYEYSQQLDRLFYDLACVEYYVNMAKEKQAKILLSLEEF